VIAGRKEWGGERERERERERDGVPSLVGAGAGACAAAAAGMKMATTRAATATAPSGALTPAILPRESLPLSPAPEEERRDGRTARPPRHAHRHRTRTHAASLSLSLPLPLSALLKKASTTWLCIGSYVILNPLASDAPWMTRGSTVTL